VTVIGMTFIVKNAARNGQKIKVNTEEETGIILFFGRRNEQSSRDK
jgi:hypothetical protein